MGRLEALISLGYINLPSDVSRFAEGFVQKPEEDQRSLLGELDEENRRMKGAARGDSQSRRG